MIDNNNHGRTKTCVICGNQFRGFSNSPRPIKLSGDCCDECNFRVVVPARLRKLLHSHSNSRRTAIIK